MSKTDDYRNANCAKIFISWRRYTLITVSVIAIILSGNYAWSAYVRKEIGDQYIIFDRKIEEIRKEVKNSLINIESYLKKLADNLPERKRK